MPVASLSLRTLSRQRAIPQRLRYNDHSARTPARFHRGIHHLQLITCTLVEKSRPHRGINPALHRFPIKRSQKAAGREGRRESGAGVFPLMQSRPLLAPRCRSVQRG